MENSQYMLHQAPEGLVISHPIPVVILSFVLSLYSLIQIPSPPTSALHNILELTQIISGLIGITISVITFWFVVVKPNMKKKKSKKH